MPSLTESLQGLQLNADEVRRNNPGWTDEMVIDYLSKQDDIRLLASAVSDIIFPLIIPGINQERASSLAAEIIQRQTPSAARYAPQIFVSKAQSGKDYAKLTRTGAMTVPTGTDFKVTGFTNTSSGISSTSESIKFITSTVANVGFSASVDATDSTPFTFSVYINGAQDEQITFTPNGALGLVDDKRPFCYSINRPFNKNDVVEIYLRHEAGYDVDIDFADAVFSARV